MSGSSLSHTTQREIRKQLVRLRMENNRQEILHNIQPLTRPVTLMFHSIKSKKQRMSQTKTPVAVGSGVLLSLLGKRFGPLGTVAKYALIAYPFIVKLRSHRRLKQETRKRSTK